MKIPKLHKATAIAALPPKVADADPIWTISGEPRTVNPQLQILSICIRYLDTDSSALSMGKNSAAIFLLDRECSALPSRKL